MAINEDAAAREPEARRTEGSGFVNEGAPSLLVALRALGRAARRLFGQWRALLALLLLYALFVSALYFFISVREASIWQVLETFLLAALAPLLFFIIQTMGVRYVEDGLRTRDLLRSSLRDFWKLLVVTLPLLLLLWLIVYLFGRFSNAPAVVAEAGRAGAAAAAATAARPVAHTPVELFSWKEVILTTLRFLILGLVLPLIAAHLWIATARLGLGGAFRNIKRVLAGALGANAVFVYAIGLLLFGVIPYFLITTNYTRGGAWTQISLLGVRLLLTSLFILFGWLITLGALSILSPLPAVEPAQREEFVAEKADTDAESNL